MPWGDAAPDGLPFVLGRLSARQIAPVKTGEPHIVAGRWRPGAAGERLAVLDDLAQVASNYPGSELGRATRLLRAEALLELGDPASLAEIDAYCSTADRLGDPVSRWQSLSRRAAAGLLADRLNAAEELGSQAAALAEQLGDADALWIADTQRWELCRFAGGRADYQRRHSTLPPVETWAPWRALILADAGDGDGATAVLAGFTAERAWGPGVNAGYDLWFPSIAAEAAAMISRSSGYSDELGMSGSPWLAAVGVVGQPHDAEGRQRERGGVIEVVPAGGLGGDGAGEGVAAAEFRVVGVEDLHPASGVRKPDAVVMARHWGEIGQADHRAPG